MKKGLGDKVEEIIKKNLPSLSKKNKDCVGCRKRKVWLNNVGANFSNDKHIGE